MLLRILIIFLFRQEREANALGAAPPKQIDHQEIEYPQAFAKRKEVPERRQLIVQLQHILQCKSQNGKPDREQEEITEQNSSG